MDPRVHLKLREERVPEERRSVPELPEQKVRVGRVVVVLPVYP